LAVANVYRKSKRIAVEAEEDRAALPALGEQSDSKTLNQT
jgi:hypothetical protein